jgi:hypothetical protein
VTTWTNSHDVHTDTVFFLGMRDCCLPRAGAKRCQENLAATDASEPHSPVPRAEQCATDDAHNRAQSDRPLQRRIRDLNALFALYQSGGLSLEEYERLKRDLIYHDRLINNALNASS